MNESEHFQQNNKIKWPNFPKIRERIRASKTFQFWYRSFIMVKSKVIKVAVLNIYTLCLMFKMENSCPGSEPRLLQGDVVDKPSDKRCGPLSFKPPERASYVLKPKNLRLIYLFDFYLTT
jgi:hypothetical protein